MATNQVVKVRRESLAACMTCPLCQDLLDEATTVTECLHTFCRKCIMRKIVDEELDYCPVCEINLGCAPLEKLRPDHALQDIRAKIFPLKTSKVVTNEVVVTTPVKKERSLSSLVVSPPKASGQNPATKRRSNAAPNKASVQGSLEDHYDAANSLETLHNLSQTLNGRQGEDYIANENGAEQCPMQSELWKPLNYLVEVASKSEATDNVTDNEGQMNIKTKEEKCKSKDGDKNNDVDPTASVAMRIKKSRRSRRRAGGSSGASSISAQAVVEAVGAVHGRKTDPIWFALVAAEDQEGSPLPQIPSSYIRLKEGNMTVLHVQKYLAKKLETVDETEIEIKCMGQPVMPTLQLSSLLEMWTQSVSSAERITVTVGSSAKDFVMVLTYGRKVERHHK